VKADALAVVGYLVSIYGQESITEDRVNGYVDNLSDIDADLLQAAARHLIATCKFFPSVSELRTTAARLAGLLPPSPAEAMAIIRRADRSERRGRLDDEGRGGYVEKFWRWPEDVPARDLEVIQDTLAKVGEPSDPNGKPFFGWELGFERTYQRAAEEIGAAVLADLSRARLGSPRSVPALTEG
jgi:hypothetical protein